MQAQQRIAGLVPSARWASGITAPSLPGNVASLLQAQQSINLPANLLPQVGAGATSQTGAEGLDTLAGTAQESFVGVEETSLMLSALSNADLMTATAATVQPEGLTRCKPFQARPCNC